MSDSKKTKKEAEGLLAEVMSNIEQGNVPDTSKLDAFLVTKEGMSALRTSKSLRAKVREVMHRVTNNLSDNLYALSSSTLDSMSDEDIDKVLDGSLIESDYANLAIFIENSVIDEVLSAPSPATRAMHYERWAVVAAKCLEKGDFHSAVSIVNGLASGPINRLKQTNQLISQDAKNSVENLVRTAGSSESYKAAIESYKAANKGHVVIPSITSESKLAAVLTAAIDGKKANIKALPEDQQEKAKKDFEKQKKAITADVRDRFTNGVKAKKIDVGCDGSALREKLEANTFNQKLIAETPKIVAEAMEVKKADKVRNLIDAGKLNPEDQKAIDEVTPNLENVAGQVKGKQSTLNDTEKYDKSQAAEKRGIEELSKKETQMLRKSVKLMRPRKLSAFQKAKIFLKGRKAPDRSQSATSAPEAPKEKSVHELVCSIEKLSVNEMGRLREEGMLEKRNDFLIELSEAEFYSKAIEWEGYEGGFLPDKMKQDLRDEMTALAKEVKEEASSKAEIEDQDALDQEALDEVMKIWQEMEGEHKSASEVKKVNISMKEQGQTQKSDFKYRYKR